LPLRMLILMQNAYSMNLERRVLKRTEFFQGPGQSFFFLVIYRQIVKCNNDLVKLSHSFFYWQFIAKLRSVTMMLQNSLKKLWSKQSSSGFIGLDWWTSSKISIAFKCGKKERKDIYNFKFHPIITKGQFTNT